MKKVSAIERMTYMARVFWINNEIWANRYPNANKIAGCFEITAAQRATSLAMRNTGFKNNL